jgi:hypothetical protein
MIESLEELFNAFEGGDLEPCQRHAVSEIYERTQLLASALRDAQKALAALTDDETIKSTTVINAYAQVRAAEANARNALKEAGCDA